MIIYKYQIEEGLVKRRNNFIINMPKGAKILSVQKQYNDYQLWALVFPDLPSEKRHFKTLITGEGFNFKDIKDLKFISTLQFNAGSFILHLFEVIK